MTQGLNTPVLHLPIRLKLTFLNASLILTCHHIPSAGMFHGSHDLHDYLVPSDAWSLGLHHVLLPLPKHPDLQTSRITCYFPDTLPQACDTCLCPPKSY